MRLLLRFRWRSVLALAAAALWVGCSLNPGPDLPSAGDDDDASGGALGGRPSSAGSGSGARSGTGGSVGTGGAPGVGGSSPSAGGTSAEAGAGGEAGGGDEPAGAAGH